MREHVGHKLAELQRIQSTLVSVYFLVVVGATAVTSLGYGCVPDQKGVKILTNSSGYLQ